jgi:uncharacterized membrane-anchored protein YhcB (DUF1043 family)
MKAYRYIRTAFIIYLVSGIILGFVIFVLMGTYRYKNQLSKILNEMNEINRMENRTRQNIAKINSITEYIRNNVTVDKTRFNSDYPFFATLDSIKDKMNESVITVARFEEAGEVRKLPLEIQTPVKNYSMIMKYAGYLESLGIPDFQFRGFSIIRRPQGEVIYTAKGVLRAPYFKTEKSQ